MMQSFLERMELVAERRRRSRSSLMEASFSI